MFNDQNDSAASSEWEETGRNMGSSPLNEYLKLPEYFKADSEDGVEYRLSLLQQARSFPTHVLNCESAAFVLQYTYVIKSSVFWNVSPCSR
jgi:hypothetical protein